MSSNRVEQTHLDISATPHQNRNASVASPTVTEGSNFAVPVPLPSRRSSASSQDPSLHVGTHAHSVTPLARGSGRTASRLRHANLQPSTSHHTFSQPSASSSSAPFTAPHTPTYSLDGLDPTMPGLSAFDFGSSPNTTDFTEDPLAFQWLAEHPGDYSHTRTTVNSQTDLYPEVPPSPLFPPYSANPYNYHSPSTDVPISADAQFGSAVNWNLIPRELEPTMYPVPAYHPSMPSPEAAHYNAIPGPSSQTLEEMDDVVQRPRRKRRRAQDDQSYSESESVQKKPWSSRPTPSRPKSQAALEKKRKSQREAQQRSRARTKETMEDYRTKAEKHEKEARYWKDKYYTLRGLYSFNLVPPQDSGENAEQNLTQESWKDDEPVEDMDIEEE